MPIAELGEHELHYKVRGEGPPVLGIMGFALDQRYWASQIPAVTGTHRFITFDNRAVGRSTGTAPTSIQEMADDAVALLDHLEIEKTVVFGMSMGGTIAQHLVLDHPERVSALILAVTWARPLEFMRRQSDLGRLILEAGGLEKFAQVSLVRMFTPPFFEVGGEVLDRMIAAQFAETGPPPISGETILAQMDALDKHDVLARLGEISVPTLVLGGKLDTLVPGFGSLEIAEAIPGAELTMFETGHACMIEEMDAFNTRVSQFLQKLV